MMEFLNLPSLKSSADISELSTMVRVDVPVDVSKNLFIFCWRLVEITDIKAPNVRNDLTNSIDVILCDRCDRAGDSSMSMERINSGVIRKERTVEH